MPEEDIPGRRRFVKFCASAMATVAAHPESLAAANKHYQPYERVLLVGSDQTPVQPDKLEAGENYMFFYPLATTPCFLLNLGRPVSTPRLLHSTSGEAYHWPGGVGRNRSVVSFSAICAHKMSHPSRSVSFINYRSEEVQFADSNMNTQRRSGVIYCCSEGSVYDPADGARVLGGPAPQPLATVVLEHDAETDLLYAVGTAGGTMFKPYFEKFWHRLELEFGTENIQRPVEHTTRVTKVSAFSRQRVLC